MKKQTTIGKAFDNIEKHYYTSLKFDASIVEMFEAMTDAIIDLRNRVSALEKRLDELGDSYG